MIFSSLIFIFRFLPILIILYYTVPRKYKNIVLMAGSLCFYAYGEPKFLLLLLASVLINFRLALWIERNRDNFGMKRVGLILALVYNFGVLFFFKYINFTIENMNIILPKNYEITPLTIALPLGISFYTFQIVSYIIDVYKGEIEAEKSLFNLGLYLCMFPQLISGPIVNYSILSYQIRDRINSFQNLEKGFKLFTIGLGFKVLIADRIGILWNDVQTIGFESISTPLAWLGTFGYSIQLYFDFYGYSLMAIGAGKMFGFSLPDNFNHPYMSRSVSEFWRRWHITLGKWFKSYVYIPLGGNRKGTRKLVFNLLVVWLLTGLWHGANWNFLLWGLTLFILICLEKLFIKNVLDKSKVISRIYVLIAVPLTWMLFAIPNLSDIRIYFGRLFGFTPGICVNTNDFIKYLGIYKWCFLSGIFFCMPFAWNWFTKHEKSIPCVIILFAVFWYSIYQLANGMNNPFLYFKF